MDPREGKRGWAGWLGALESELDQGGLEWLDRIAHQVLDRALLRRGDVVADLGAGTGLLSLRAAREVGPEGRVIAVDSSEQCLDALRAKAREAGLENVETLQGELEALPLASASCTRAVCRSALVYTPDIAQALVEMRRVLAGGGRFSVFEPLPAESAVISREGEPPQDPDFVLMERTLAEKRSSYSLDRVALRDAFEAAGLAGSDSLLLHFTVTMSGRSEEEIRAEYLWDLPGDLAAFTVLRSEFEEDRILDAATWFARCASEGRLAVRVPALLVWGESPRA